MQSSVAMAILALFMANGGALCASAQAADDGGADRPDGIGPDIIVGAIQGTHHYGQIDGVHAYTIGTTSCNVGSEPIDWNPGINRHPVIAQNMYRIKDGRIEQIGLSWLKHGLSALQGDLCATGCIPAGGPQLGVGCSDPYWALLNGVQASMGPRFEVNPFTGAFPYPFSNPAGLTGDLLFKRIQVPRDVLDDDDAVYVAESIYVTPDDAAAGNLHNNASYRRFIFGRRLTLDLQGETQVERAAMYSWRDHGRGPDQLDATVMVTSGGRESDGRFLVGSKVWAIPGGRWHYEFAVQNINAHHPGGSFTIQLPSDASVENVGFHDVDYHSGEPFDPTDWAWSFDAGTLEWSTTHTFEDNPDANALRWGTLYSFWFDANVPPRPGMVALGIFGPTSGSDESVSVEFQAHVPNTCPWDLDGDGVIAQSDLDIFIEQFGQHVPPGTGADLTRDGVVTSSDLIQLLTQFGRRCGEPIETDPIAGGGGEDESGQEPLPDPELPDDVVQLFE